MPSCQQLQYQEQQLAERDALLQRKDHKIALRETRIEKITFESGFGVTRPLQPAAWGTTTKPARRRPRCNPFPDHLRRSELRHEPEHTDCQERNCRRPMTRNR